MVAVPEYDQCKITTEPRKLGVLEGLFSHFGLTVLQADDTAWLQG